MITGEYDFSRTDTVQASTKTVTSATREMGFLKNGK